AILAANHASFMDSPVLQAASGRRIIYFMTERFYDPLWGRWFFKRMHCIPVHENTVYNLASLRIALSLLKEGKVIGIFPEGGISRDGRLQKARPGALLLAQKSSAPIVPAFISGTYQALPRHAKFFRKAKITVSFGNPLFFNELSNSLSGKSGLEKATDNLFKKFRELGPNHP
ncbi:MAG: 1-acyl-sn-glycerol-3-phosphate acyltransferase, partial [Deltaproteobacteria bacterium]|nr:1-acyl-sn-glycerol-3-phosphate acyltransferase [Deltaproteobacteria bacterium]